jgi:hypothetical protein
MERYLTRSPTQAASRARQQITGIKKSGQKKASPKAGFKGLNLLGVVS